MNEGIMDVVRSHFRSEFINRLDDILVFKQLTMDSMKSIAQIQMRNLVKLLAEKNIKIDVTDEALEHLAKLGFNPLMGARPLKRVLQTHIQDPLADDIIEGRIQPENTVIIKVDDEKFILETEEAK